MLSEIIQSICKTKPWYLYSENAGSAPQISYDLKELFNSVRHGYKKSCYWIAIEPFNFFADVDLYGEKTQKYNIQDILNKLENIADYFLVCESPSTQGRSFRIFTNRIVSYQDAVLLEKELRNNFDVIDNIIEKRTEYAYTRSAYSLHGTLRSRMMIPKKELSKLPSNNMDELDLFEFSCPNNSIYEQSRIIVGDCLSSLFGKNWKKVYEDEKNDSFRRFHPNPNVIYAGTPITYPKYAKLSQKNEHIKIIKQYLPKNGGKTFFILAQSFGDSIAQLPSVSLFKNYGKVILFSKRTSILKNAQNIFDELIHYDNFDTIKDCIKNNFTDNDLIVWPHYCTSSVMQHVVETYPGENITWPGKCFGMKMSYETSARPWRGITQLYLEQEGSQDIDLYTDFAISYGFKNCPETPELNFKCHNNNKVLIHTGSKQKIKKIHPSIVKKIQDSLESLGIETIVTYDEIIDGISTNYKDLLSEYKIKHADIRGHNFYQLIADSSVLLSLDGGPMHFRIAINKPAVFIQTCIPYYTFYRKNNNVFIYNGPYQNTELGVNNLDVSKIIEYVFKSISGSKC